MDYIVVEGVPPYDGRYGFDIDESPLTTREWGWVKRHSGYLPLTIDDGLRGVDWELVNVLAVIVLRRHGKLTAAEVPEVLERLLDVEGGKLTFAAGDTARVAEPDPTASSNGSASSSGADSPMSSGTSAPIPAATGTDGSDTWVSDRVTSAS